MIQLLNKKYRQAIAYIFFILFYVSWAAPAYAGSTGGKKNYSQGLPISFTVKQPKHSINGMPKKYNVKNIIPPAQPATFIPHGGIGGPSQPEMSSFKSVSTDNMVDLFTGNFSYNVPLLDVGGYPVNIYYDGNVTMEEEASWVGLGWNINPGSVSRNLRGIPDDFDGTDMMEENQYLKPNTTWGGRFGADYEICGYKNMSLSAGNLGVSVNSYLGPSLEIGIKGGVNFNLAKKSQSEKSPGDDTLNSGLNFLNTEIGLTLSSRSGLSLSGSASLTSRSFKANRFNILGLSLSTSYNSRTGIKDLQVSGDMHIPRVGDQSIGAAISFARPSYIPTIRMPMVNTAWSGHFQAGSGLFGNFPSAEIEVYSQTSEVAQTDQKKPLVGYMYYQNAVSNRDAVMDFTRLGDKEVTAHTPVISAPQYTYDIFTVQGEGTGGTIRAYRTDLGYVRDNFTGSSDNSVGIGADIGPPGHFGGNVNLVKTPTTIDKWQDGNNLDAGGTVNFTQGKDLHELVYMRNPGESSVLDNGWFNNIGGTDMVRFKLGGDAHAPTIEPALQHYDGQGNQTTSTAISNAANPTARVKRSQVISFLTANEASIAGLDKTINSYNAATPVLDAGTSTNHNYYLNCDNKIHRYDPSDPLNYRLAHHISQINVTEADGKRYVYGIPVYNVTQTDFTFSVKNVISPDNDKVVINSDGSNWMNTSSLLKNVDGIDGYIQSTSTPAYAHSFLLTGLLSPDYVDVTGDGITEDDLGSAVKFNYSLMPTVHKWRTPLTKNDNSNNPVYDANLNAGNRSETKDDKGMVSYGEREQWYLHSIESKTMVAIFTLATRDDGKGAMGETGGVNGSDNSIRRLDHIDLYNKADLKANGPYNGSTGARPIKTVWFDYSYRLCRGTPDNGNPTDAAFTTDPVTGEALAGGKLTLERIYFTFNGQGRTNKTQYVFSYANTDVNTHQVITYHNDITSSKIISGNPTYEFNATDRWGTYKPYKQPSANSSNDALNNPGDLHNKDYAYSLQDNTNNKINENAGAWALKKILLPSGGQIEVSYESDDYAYVQNRRATQMMQVTGFMHDVPTTTSTFSNTLYDFTKIGPIVTYKDNYYVIVRVQQACSSDDEVMEKYLKGINQFSFRYSVMMPKGNEYITSYATLAREKDEAGNDLGSIVGTDYGHFSISGGDNQGNYIWIKVQSVNYNDKIDLSPLSLTALEYLREQLPGQAFPGSDLGGSGVDKVAGMLQGLLTGLESAFTDPIKYLRSVGNGARVVESGADGTLKCFVRLNNVSGFKYGGGSRVHSITLKDNWDAMTSHNGANAGQYPSTYGQVYDYTTTETWSDGTSHPISSGVASYEPSIGGEENPFTEMVQYEDRLPLGPASEGAAEMPVLDAFYPAGVVGYSKVTVRSLADANANLLTDKKLKSSIGKQVTEFYTAKDFPSYSNYTSLDRTSSDIQDHNASLTLFLWKRAFDSRAISQGFLVVTNDMHGKMKSQSSFAADGKTRINYTENFYKNTGANGLDDVFDFADETANGLITSGNMGVDIELMTDARQFTVKSKSEELQLQVDFFPVFPPAAWLPFPWPVSGKSESYYRAVTTTKVVNYHSVVEKVIVIDKGSQVTTQNLLRDAQTGEVLVNQTNNEFDQPVYTTTYPAYWAYSGMGPAYQNIDAVYSGVNFSNGLIKSDGTQVPAGILESGDELLILGATAPTSGCDVAIASITDMQVIWAYNQDKNTSALTDPNTNPPFIFIDAAGNPYTNYNVKFRIIRSGKRNLLGNKLQAVTNMLVSPIVPQSGQRHLSIGINSNPINVSAIEYKEKWQTDPDEIGTFETVVTDCLPAEVPSCTTTASTYHLEKGINPYRKGLLGNYSVDRNLVYYSGRAETIPTDPTNLQKNGFLDNSSDKPFALYWSFNNTAGMQPLGTRDVNSSSNWVFKGRTTRKNAVGMELETVDALNIYTTAQYGYNKTLPTAITANAAYGRAAYEGFEDKEYNNSVNGKDFDNCSFKKYIDFNISNAQIIPAASQGFNAHTGKNVLQVSSNESHNNAATKTFNVAGIGNNDFNLQFGSKQTPNLTDVGWKFNFEPTDPTTSSISPALTTTDADGFSYSNVDDQIGITVSVPSTHHASFTTNWQTYVEIQSPGTYSFALSVNSNFHSDNINVSYSNTLGFYIADNNGNQLSSTQSITASLSDLDNGSQNKSDNFTFTLCPGIYHIVGSGALNFNSSNVDDGVCTYTFKSTPSTPQLTLYRTNIEQNTCPHTTPIPGSTANIMHPVFAIPAPVTVQGEAKEQLMVFSTWVHEDGAAVNQKTFSGNKVTFEFFDASNNPVAQKVYNNTGQSSSTQNSIDFQPAGPIIDGWQRYEVYFSAPANAAKFNLSFINTGTNNIYFDDIRIFPFNANMTSYVYDPITQRLVAQLDANNYASYYEYDAEGTLIRTKAETIQGIKTINETRSAKQKNITILH